MSFDAGTLMLALEYGNPIPDILPTMSRQEANLSWLLAEAVWNQEINFAIQGKVPRRHPTMLPAGTRWVERNKASILPFRWRPRDADHTATGKRPFPSIFGRDRLPMKRQE